MATTNFTCVQGLPRLSAEPHAFAMRWIGPALIHCAYECQRDFLSAPKRYVHLSVTLSSPAYFGLGGQMLDDTQWAEFNALDYGVYVRAEHECQVISAVSTEAESIAAGHVLFSFNGGVFECVATTVQLIDSARYHCADVYDVLG